MSSALAVALVTGIVGIAVAVLGYFGLRYQSRSAKAAADTTASLDHQGQLLKGWQDLFEGYRTEVETLRTKQRELDDDQGRVRTELEDMRRKHEALTRELRRWQQAAKTLARWGVSMRDQLRALGHEIPAEPDELVTLQILSDNHPEEYR